MGSLFIEIFGPKTVYENNLIYIKTIRHLGSIKHSFTVFSDKKLPIFIFLSYKLKRLAELNRVIEAWIVCRYLPRPCQNCPIRTLEPRKKTWSTPISCADNVYSSCTRPRRPTTLFIKSSSWIRITPRPTTTEAWVEWLQITRNAYRTLIAHWPSIPSCSRRFWHAHASTACRAASPKPYLTAIRRSSWIRKQCEATCTGAL